MIDNSLDKLLEEVEPKIRNIEENRIEELSLKDVYETIQTLVELGGQSYNEIFDFYDQDFIFKAIKIGNSNANDLIDKYKSAKYLLKNDNQSFKELPQFKESVDFMEALYKYLYGLNEKIKLDYESKSENLKIQELLNKYYNLLNRDNIFIKDIEEFLTFLDLNKLSIEERINILIFINKCNLKTYVTTNNINIGSDINLLDIIQLINRNKELLNKEYQKTNIELNLDEYLLKNIDNVFESILNKKIYLINKINDKYKVKNYSEIVSDYKEFKRLENLEKEFVKQKNSSRELVFMFKNNKSLVREYLDKTSSKYKSCILKNLLDLEKNNSFVLPNMCYNNNYLYVKDDFVVKTIYTFKNNKILILGVLDKGEKIEDFLDKNEYIINEFLENADFSMYDESERNLILNDIKLEDLVLTIDLDTLDIKTEDKNGR